MADNTGPIHDLQGTPGSMASKARSTPPHRRSFDLADGFAFFNIFSLIYFRFPFADSQGHFHLSVLPIKRQREQCVAFDRCQPKGLPNLRLMEEQFTDRFRFMVLEVSVRILLDVGVVKEDLPILDPGEGVTDLTFAGSEGFHLGAVKHDAGLKGLKDMIFAAGSGVV